MSELRIVKITLGLAWAASLLSLVTQFALVSG
jgi:hypothetical protein